VQSPPATLFRDPIYDGAADPAIVYNHLGKYWWIFYTNRRANMKLPGKAFMHGTDIGIAESKDGGRTWLYRGAIDIQYGRGRNTFWAPEVIFYEGEYHMYVSFVPGVSQDWNADRYILYYKSKNLWDWEFICKLELSSNKVIDACVFHMPDGTFRMWYKDEADHSYIYVAESTNLKDWKILGPALTDRPLIYSTLHILKEWKVQKSFGKTIDIGEHLFRLQSLNMWMAKLCVTGMKNSIFIFRIYFRVFFDKEKIFCPPY